MLTMRWRRHSCRAGPSQIIRKATLSGVCTFPNPHPPTLSNRDAVSYVVAARRLIRLLAWRPTMFAQQGRPDDKETKMSDLNDASKTTPPKDSKLKLEKTEEESRKLDSPTRTNDSTIDPDKPLKDILEGYHGG